MKKLLLWLALIAGAPLPAMAAGETSLKFGRVTGTPSTIADELPPKIVLSAPLVDEIFRALVCASKPPSDVAVAISKLQAEVAHQPVPIAAPSPTPLHQPHGSLSPHEQEGE